MPISSLVKGTLAEAAAARGWSQDSQPMAWFGTQRHIAVVYYSLHIAVCTLQSAYCSLHIAVCILQ